jgi:ATP-dependent RNA helicase RhlB
MVFVNTKAFVERVARALEKAGYRVGVLSGDVPQKKRESLLKKFQAGNLEILVATDVAARGLHIDGVSHVYNYDLPFDAEDYVHRIGRTARLGAEGDAISFACERYAMSLPDIEAYIEQKLPVAQVEKELLIPVPRAPRAPVEGDDGEGESVSAIFREVREAKAAEDERRGGRGGRSGSGSGGGGRGGPGGGSRERSGPRPGAHRERKPAVTATEGAAEVVERPAQRPAPSSPMQVDPNAPARKRRRRRGGRPVGDAAANAEAGGKPRGERKPEGSAPAASSSDKPSLLGRIKAGLKSLVKRSPPSGH